MLAGANIALLPLKIIRFVDTYPPGLVECEFKDGENRKHAIIDKSPFFTTDDIWVDSQYPRDGRLRCRVLERIKNVAGHELARITIAEPDQLETTEGLSEFVVLASQLSGDR